MSHAFVDFLLNTTPENRALFEATWKGLRRQAGATEVTREAFAQLNLEAVNQEFWTFVERRAQSR